MNICLKCGKYPFCTKADTSVQNCTEWVKRSYETKLVKVDGLNYKFEEVK